MYATISARMPLDATPNAPSTQWSTVNTKIIFIWCAIKSRLLSWAHQNRASPFASDFCRRRRNRKEFRSEDHFYPFSSQRKSRFASDFLRRGNRASWGLKTSRDFSGSGKNRRRNRRESRDFGALSSLAAQCKIPPPHIARFSFEMVSQRGYRTHFALFSCGIVQVSLRTPCCGEDIAPPLRMLSKGERLRKGGGGAHPICHAETPKTPSLR